MILQNIDKKVNNDLNKLDKEKKQITKNNNFIKVNNKENNNVSSDRCNVYDIFGQDFKINILNRNIKESSFLEKHSIKEINRAKFINWLIEVCDVYNCSEKCYFLTIAIIDEFLLKSDKNFQKNDLLLIGLTSLFIAGKLEEVLPFKLSTILKDLSFSKLKKNDIITMETQILYKLRFNMEILTINEITNFILFELNLYYNEKYNKIKKIILYVNKLIKFNYQIISSYNEIYLSISSVYISFKIMEQFYKNFNTKIYLEKLKNIFEINNITFYNCSQCILSLAKNYDYIYKDLYNLKKFNSFK